ncbi:MAG: ABC transporter permease [Labilithrix sp.]|nr:ABC transporter permease [Labilithrix sp.]MCW5814629.1 ABC transporter permease [Labilithrix sp.]
MGTLLKFAWRELLRAKGRFALIALILTLQAAALGGGYVAQESLYSTRDAWAEKLRLADLEVQFTPASDTEMPSLDVVRRVPGVSAVNRRFIATGYIERVSKTGEGAPLPVVIQYLEPAAHPTVNDIELTSGSWLEKGKPEHAIVDRSFAEAQALQAGDEIVVNPHRFSSRFTVGGTGLSAEYLVPTANPSLLVPHKGSLGIIYASRESLDRTFPEVLYNSVVVTFDKGADKQKTMDAVLASLDGLEIERVVTKDQTFGYRFLDVILSGSRSVTPIIALIVALMASIVAVISMHRLVAERRKEIGAFLAQGWSPGQLSALFFGLGFVPGLAGAILGVPAAMGFASKVAKTSSVISGFPSPIMSWDVTYLALGAGSAIAVGLASAIAPAIGVLRIAPAHALRGSGEIAFDGMPAFLEKLLSGNIATRYAVRNVFRRVRLSAATATLVALAVALPSALLTTIASWDTWATTEAGKLHWDAITAFKVPLAEEQVKEMMEDSGVSSFRGYLQSYAPVRRENGSIQEMRIRGLPKQDEMVTHGLFVGAPFSSETAAEAYLNSAFAGANPPHIGERIAIVRKGVVHELVVVGLTRDAALSTIVVPRATAQRIFGMEGKISGAYVKFGQVPTGPKKAPEGPAIKRGENAEVVETLDLGEAANVPAPTVAPRPTDPKVALLADESITSVEVRTEYASKTLAYLSSFNVIVVPFIGLSGVLAFFFLVSVLGFLLLERETEYATLRSLGYGGGEIARIVLTEVGLLAMAGLVLSLGAWVVTAYALRMPMASTWFAVPLDFRPHDFMVASVPTLVFLVFAALPGIRALLSMDLSSVLRGRAIG